MVRRDYHGWSSTGARAALTRLSPRCSVPRRGPARGALRSRVRRLRPRGREAGQVRAHPPPGRASPDRTRCAAALGTELRETPVRYSVAWIGKLSYVATFVIFILHQLTGSLAGLPAAPETRQGPPLRCRGGRRRYSAEGTTWAAGCRSRESPHCRSPAGCSSSDVATPCFALRLLNHLLSEVFMAPAPEDRVPEATDRDRREGDGLCGTRVPRYRRTDLESRVITYNPAGRVGQTIRAMLTSEADRRHVQPAARHFGMVAASIRATIGDKARLNKCPPLTGEAEV